MAKEKENSDCFVIMPISNQPGYEDNHFTLVYEDIIKPSIENNKMLPIRADETKNTNLIQLDILKKIINSPLAVCDMSSKNPNVFYELGMRQAFDLPTVLMIDDNTKVPFDISGLRYVNYKKEMTYRNVKKTITELTDAIKDTYDKKDDKTEINSLIRLMELTSAKLDNSNISPDEKIELLNGLELKEIKKSIKDLTLSQNTLLTLLDKNPKDKNFINNDNLDSIYDVGDIVYREGNLFGKILATSPNAVVIEKPSGEIGHYQKDSKIWKELSIFPF